MPLANYINYVNKETSELYLFNSRWKIRHFLMAFLAVPLLIFLYGSELNVLPNDSVIDGHKLWAHDVRFLQKKRVFPSDEKPVLFYSDAVLMIRNDGNGFTENHVFSYWKDDNDHFNIQNANMSEIRDIAVAFTNEWNENTVITITKEDGTNFVLYVSNTNGKDKKFVEALKNRWNIARPDLTPNQ